MTSSWTQRRSSARIFYWFSKVRSFSLQLSVSFVHRVLHFITTIPTLPLLPTGGTLQTQFEHTIAFFTQRSSGVPACPKDWKGGTWSTCLMGMMPMSIVHYP